MDTNCKAVITDPSVYIVFRYKLGFYRMAVILLTLISIFYMYMYMTAIYFKEDFKVNTAVPLLESGGFVNFIIFVGAITGWLTPIYAATDCMRKCTQDVVSNAGCARIMFNIFCQFRNHKVPIPLGKKKKTQIVHHVHIIGLQAYAYSPSIMVRTFFMFVMKNTVG